MLASCGQFLDTLSTTGLQDPRVVLPEEAPIHPLLVVSELKRKNPHALLLLATRVSLHLELAHSDFDVVGITTELEQEDAARVALN